MLIEADGSGLREWSTVADCGGAGGEKTRTDAVPCASLHRANERAVRGRVGVAAVERTIVACCDAVAQSLRDSRRTDRVHVIPNGTADLGFVERSFEKRCAIGIIGRIVARKRAGGISARGCGSFASGARADS